jgi:NAD(P) transhydrogenase subunit alpha
VIVDLAVEQGGNVEGSVPGEVVVRQGGKIVGQRNVPSRVATDASALYARNLYNFISAFWDKDSKVLTLDSADEIVAGVTLTRAGAVVHPAFAGK